MREDCERRASSGPPARLAKTLGPFVRPGLSRSSVFFSRFLSLLLSSVVEKFFFTF
jgi:hypothetical protein